MKIKMITTAAGPIGNFIEGGEYDVPGDISEVQAKQFVDARSAIVLDTEKIETATAPPPETAMKKRGKKSK